MAELLTSYAPAVEVGPPPASPRRYGLLSVALPVDTSRAAEGGFQWEPDCGTLGVTTGDCLYEPETDLISPSPYTCSDMRMAWPFVVYALDNGPVIGETLDEARARVERRLALGEEVAVEREVWTGEARGFTSPPGLILSDSPVIIEMSSISLPDGLGQVEAALAAAYGGQGVIHLSPYAVTVLGFDHFTIEGGRLFTIAGSRVVVGGGYVRTDLGGAIETIVGTGPVRVARSAVTVTDANVFNRETNTAMIVAQRAYSVAWDCAHVAALVTIPGPPT